MAVNVNTVYTTVLFILNKEQRGYVPPGEFNSLAAQVQREIFESYFPDGNQINRANQNNTQNNTEFFNISEDIQDKITPFEEEVQLSLGPNSTFTRPQVSDTGSANRSIRKFGSVISTYADQPVYNSITQLTTKSDYDKITRSKLTAPTKQNPIYYSYKGTSTSPYLKINPLPDSVSANCLVYPSNPFWNFSPGSSGQYIYSSFNSVDFELDSSEQTNIIMHVLKYCGVIINNPSVVQTAAQDIQQTTINEKS
jgi:hypothetical protein